VLITLFLIEHELDDALNDLWNFPVMYLHHTLALVIMTVNLAELSTRWMTFSLVELSIMNSLLVNF